MLLILVQLYQNSQHQRVHRDGVIDTQEPVFLEATGESALPPLFPPGRDIPCATAGGRVSRVPGIRWAGVGTFGEGWHPVLPHRRKPEHYTLREDSPILDDLRNIFLKTAGAGAELRAELERIAGIELAFIYGSYVSGEAHAASDIDLMVVGDVTDRDLAPAIARVERRLKRQIDYALYTSTEAEKRSRGKGEFVREVLLGPKIVLLGNPDDRLFRVA